jgi:hypothetical protein
MGEPMPTYVEVWPVAADEARIWLLSGNGPWEPPLPVMSDSEPHWEVELALRGNGALDPPLMLHSTSWRVDGQHLVLTYIAVIRVVGLVLDTWPQAQPVSLELATAVGKPLSYHPAEPPTPRSIDVLLHAIRHLRFLMDTDSGNAATLDQHWRAQLSRLAPALSGMYLSGEAE